MDFPDQLTLALATICLLAVVAISIVPGLDQPDSSALDRLVALTPTPVQKVMHVIAYATLAFIWVLALEEWLSSAARISALLIGLIAIGALLEWYQTTIPSRYGTFKDVMLNATGTAFGMLASMNYI